MAYEGNPFGESTGAGATPSRLGRKAPTLSDRLGKTKQVASAGFGRTKSVAAVGFEKSKVAAVKIKVGAAAGFSWIKLKYKKSNLFQKK